MECCLLECKKPVNSETGKVEVRAFQISSSQREGLKVGWNESGEAVFHPACWNRLVKAATTKDQKPESDALQLNVLATDLVLEAKKHAEDHDPDGEVNAEATAATTNDQKPESDALQLNALETDLVLEAKKHAEYHDPDGEVKAEAARIAQMIKNAKYCIGFTGAGISTAAGISDFRGKDGLWTANAKKKEYGQKGLKKGASRGYKLNDLRPTYTHEAIMKLIELGHIKFLISQNTDGLHRLSGVPEGKISELHGNSFVERCEKCPARYMRPKSCRTYGQTTKNVLPKPCENCKISHRTGRICEKKGCRGYLMNTIIHFGDYLEDPVLGTAEKNAEQADLVLCLGSTLRVSPASDLVEAGQQPVRLVICNRQGTPYDDDCRQVDERGTHLGSRIFGDCDKLMKEVMLALFDQEFVKDWEDERESRMKTYDKRRT